VWTMSGAQRGGGSRGRGAAAARVQEAEAMGGARKEKSVHVGCYIHPEPDPSRFSHPTGPTSRAPSFTDTKPKALGDLGSGLLGIRVSGPKTRTNLKVDRFLAFAI
jgi:hypothetical protein